METKQYATRGAHLLLLCLQCTSPLPLHSFVLISIAATWADVISPTASAARDDKFQVIGLRAP
jgi:hypothetical protein